MNKKLRVYQTLTVVFAVLAMFFLFKWWVTFGQIVSVSLVAHQIETTRRLVLETEWKDSQETSEVALGNLAFTVPYYESYSNTLARCPMGHFVKAEYERMVHDVITLLQKETGKDYGDDPHPWIDHHTTERDNNWKANQVPEATARKLADPQH